MHRFLLIPLSAVVGLGSGLALRHWHRPAGATASAFGTGPVATVTLPKLIARHPSPLADRLEADLSLSTGVTRWLLWMSAVEKASLSDYPRLALIAKEMPGAMRMLAARWVQQDPKHMFTALLELVGSDAVGKAKYDLSDVLFTEWPKSDPEAVLTALNSRAVPQNWRMTALNTFFETDPERGVRAMSAWNVSSYGPSMKGVAAWTARDPQHAAEVALANPSGFGSRMLIEKIGAEWSKSDPESALAFATGNKSVLGRDLAAHTIRAWAERDISKASEWLAKADGPTREQLLPAFAEAWGKKDPSAALAWCQANATPSMQAEVVSSLLKGTAKKDLGDAAALVMQLEPGPARSRAARAVADIAREKEWFPSYNTSQQDRTVKPEAVAWLNGLDPDARREALTQVYWSWAEGDPKGFSEYLSTLPGREATEPILSTTAQNLARLNPREALEWAGKLNEGVRDRTLSTAFSTWLSSQPKTAMEWLRSLDGSDPRRVPVMAGAVSSALPWQVQNAHPGVGEAIGQSLLKGDLAGARAGLSQLQMTPDEYSRAVQILDIGKAE